MTAAADAAARVARESYGRLVALLAARTRDIAAAEDALGDALAAALSAWPTGGVPRNPEAWLLTAARRRMLDAGRAASVRARAEPTLRLAADLVATDEATGTVPDRRLALLFACTHPAIAPAIQAPLMLQVVLGLDAAQIASAFLVSPAAMGQALSRAKAKLRDAAVPFDEPGPEERPARVGAVLDAVYAAFGLAQGDAAGEARAALAEEALWLARLTAALIPEEPEALGLLALLLHVAARSDARRDAAGAYVPLADQETSRWDRAMIEEAEGLLLRAAAQGRAGRYQLEAAIQSAHAARFFGHAADAEAVALLYESLVTVAPSTGALVGRAGALAAARGAEAGLAALEAIAGAEAYQPWWAMRADLLARLGRAEAAGAYARASGLAEDPAVRAFLAARLAASTQPGGSAPT
jgi:RNA polymerase sigma-70 factor (ECF subfamily)